MFCDISVSVKDYLYRRNVFRSLTEWVVFAKFGTFIQNWDSEVVLIKSLKDFFYAKENKWDTNKSPKKLTSWDRKNNCRVAL